MHGAGESNDKPQALSLLAGERPRNVGWLQAGGFLFGDWGTSRLYVLGLALLFAGRTSFWLILAMSALILSVGWAYTQICRIYPDGGGVYTAAKHHSRTLAVIGALLLFADYTVTASLSSLDAFHYFGLPLTKHAQIDRAKQAASGHSPHLVTDAGDAIAIAHETALLATLPALPAGVDLPTESTGGSPLYYAPDEHVLRWGGGEMGKPARDRYLARSNDLEYQLAVKSLYQQSQSESLFAWDSPGLWAIIAIAAIGLFNLMGPKHTGGFAIFAAVGMVAITVLITVSAVTSGKIDWGALGGRLGNPLQHPGEMWVAFVSIVLALSGVEAIANLTGVMKKPVAKTAAKSIWLVAGEVALFNIILAVIMLAIKPIDREAHVNDMLAFLTSHYVGAWGEWLVRIVGGALLLSATNTALTDMISVQYLMARDNELPGFMVALNRFGVPWIPAIVAAGVPILILLISHNLESLAALYAIGVIGAVAINVTLCSGHPRLRRLRRKGPMVALGVVLIAIWITLAFTKLHALVFVASVLTVGLTARAITKFAQKRWPKPSLLRQAILEQMPPDALALPRVMVGTYGSESLALPALEEAKRAGAALVVCFIRAIQLSYKYETDRKLTIDNDPAAQKTFARFLELGHEAGVPVVPVYDTGPDAAVLMAENAAIHGARRVLIGTSRQGALYHLIKGHFQRRLESLLPPEIPVQVVTPTSSVDLDEVPAPQ